MREKRARERRDGRPSLPDTLPEVNVTIEPDLTGCPCCQGPLHRIGEDVSRRLDIIPVQYRRLVTHRPKYACRSCEGSVVQAPAPERLISRRLAHRSDGRLRWSSAKYADHRPLYRQSQGAGAPRHHRSVGTFWRSGSATSPLR